MFQFPFPPVPIKLGHWGIIFKDVLVVLLNCVIAGIQDRKSLRRGGMC